MSRKADLLELTKAALIEEAARLNIPNTGRMNKNTLATAIIDAEQVAAPPQQAATSEEDRRVEEILADIIMAWRAGAKIAQISESDEAIQAAVELRLTEEERQKVCWGGSSAKHIVG